MRGSPPPVHGDRGASRAVEVVAVLLVSTALVLAVIGSPLREGVSCLGQRTIALLQSSGGSVCGADVAPTRLDQLPGLP